MSRNADLHNDALIKSLDQFERMANEIKRQCYLLIYANEKLREIKIEGDWGPETVAKTCETVAHQQDSSLHEAAALMIRRLMWELDKAKAVAANS